MKNKYIIRGLIFLAGFFIFAESLQAYQPQVVLNETKIIVKDVEISKAYYGELDGQANFFEIHSEAPFNLYINVLVPDIMGVQKNISFEIRKNGQIIAVMDGVNFEWTNFYEPFAGDNYFKGLEYRQQVEAGDYEIKVFSPYNFGKYVLTIGETESLIISEIFKTIKVVPQIKKDFFGESTISAYLNQITLLLLVIIIAIAGIVWSVVLAYHKKIKPDMVKSGTA